MLLLVQELKVLGTINKSVYYSIGVCFVWESQAVDNKSSFLNMYSQGVICIDIKHDLHLVKKH